MITITDNQQYVCVCSGSLILSPHWSVTNVFIKFYNEFINMIVIFAFKNIKWKIFSVMNLFEIFTLQLKKKKKTEIVSHPSVIT